MRSDRKSDRFIRRLETEFTAEGKTYRGISSNLSITGLFIRTSHPFAPGSLVDITIHLPDSGASHLKGIVKNAFKSQVLGLKNGMGVQITEKDANYIDFLKTVFPDLKASPDIKPGNPESSSPKPSAPPSGQASPDFTILSCPKCGVKNKVHKAKTSLGPKCGKCGSPLIINLA